MNPTGTDIGNGYCARAAERAAITTIITREVDKFSARVEFYSNVK